MNRVLCSTGTSIGRPNGRDFTLLLNCLERLDCDGYEFMMYDTWYGKIGEIRDFMIRFPAPVPVFHCEKGIGERISRDEAGDEEEAVRLFEINCALARDIGAETLVLHLWSGIHSDKNILHNIAVYGRLRETAQRYGRTLTVENVVCNHEDPMTHMTRLTEAYPDVRFTFDTKMAEFHRQMDRLYTDEGRGLFSRVSHMHINDFRGGYKEWGRLRTLHVGDGQIDFERLFAFVRESGYSGDFTVEATSFDETGRIDFEALNRDFQRIRGYLH